MSSAKTGKKRKEDGETQPKGGGQNGVFLNKEKLLSRLGALRKQRKNNWLLSIYDPEKYDGVRIPDDFAMPSATIQSKTSQLITTHTTGNGCALALPRPGAQQLLYNDSGAGATIASVSSKDDDEYTAMQAAFSKYRVVSMILKLTYIGKDDDMAGEFFWGYTPDVIDFTGITLNNIETLFVDEDYFEWHPTDKHGVHTLFFPDGPDDKVYRDITYADAAPSLMVAWRGLPASTKCLRLDTVVNYELRVKTSHRNLIQAEVSTPDPLALSHAHAVMADDSVQIGGAIMSAPGGHNDPQVHRRTNSFMQTVSDIGNFAKDNWGWLSAAGEFLLDLL